MQGEELDEASIDEYFRKGLSVLHGDMEIMQMFAENGESSTGGYLQWGRKCARITGDILLAAVTIPAVM